MEFLLSDWNQQRATESKNSIEIRDHISCRFHTKAFRKILFSSSWLLETRQLDSANVCRLLALESFSDNKISTWNGGNHSTQKYAIHDSRSFNLLMNYNEECEREKKGKNYFHCSFSRQSEKNSSASCTPWSSVWYTENVVRKWNKSRNDFQQKYITSKSKMIWEEINVKSSTCEIEFFAEFLWFYDVLFMLQKKIDLEKYFYESILVRSVNLWIISRGFMDNWIQTQAAVQWNREIS